MQRPHDSRGAATGEVSVAAGAVPVAARGDVRAWPVPPERETSVKAARVAAPAGTAPDIPRYLAIRPSDRIA
ncbi:hypothetical protein GCM10010177_05430 [Actinomadura citrea]|nr:hypothetical protein GCM10010177_05430 [Actinomadura citrea]